MTQSSVPHSPLILPERNNDLGHSALILLGVESIVVVGIIFMAAVIFSFGITTEPGTAPRHAQLTTVAR